MRQRYDSVNHASTVKCAGFDIREKTAVEKRLLLFFGEGEDDSCGGEWQGGGLSLQK